MLEWSDLRIFLAVARAGSTLQAAHVLGINQTTVSRRIQALEAALGLTLFARRSTGYSLTGHGKILLDSAIRVEGSVQAFVSDADRLRRLSGTVIRVTAPESMFAHLLAPIVRAYRRDHPEIRIEQVSSERYLDLERGEADIAFRSIKQPPEERLIAQRLPDMAWTLYCSADYAAEHGMPGGPEDLRNHAVLVYDSALEQTRWGHWLAAHADPERIAARSNSVTNMVGLIRASLGVGLLPCLDGDTAALLRCIDPPPPELFGAWWLLMTPEVHHVPAVRRFTDFAVTQLRKQRRFVAGERDAKAG